MQVRMVEDVLSPGMENGKDTDFGAEMLRVGGKGEKRSGSRAKEDAVNDSLILKREGREVSRYGEDDVIVLYREEFTAAFLEPLGLGERLTLRAVTIAAGIVRDLLVTALIARFDVSPESGGSARDDVIQYTPLLERHNGAVPLDVVVAMFADDVRDLEPRTLHSTQRFSGTSRGSESSGLAVRSTFSIATCV